MLISVMLIQMLNVSFVLLVMYAVSICYMHIRIYILLFCVGL